jgi:hypothetical protein
MVAVVVVVVVVVVVAVVVFREVGFPVSCVVQIICVTRCNSPRWILTKMIPRGKNQYESDICLSTELNITDISGCCALTYVK